MSREFIITKKSGSGRFNNRFPYSLLEIIDGEEFPKLIRNYTKLELAEKRRDEEMGKTEEKE
jgi:hypothetical protein